MKFCTTCGTERDPNSLFCQECGTKYESTSSGTKPDEINQKPVTKQTPSPPATPQPIKLTKKQKQIFVGVAAVCLLIFGLFKVGESLTDGKKVAAGFRDAVVEQDANTVLDYLTAENWDGELTEDHANEIISYFHSDTMTLGTFEQYIDEQISVLDSNEASAAEGYYTTSGLDSLSFQKTGKTFLFYDKYEFTLEAFPLLVYSNHEDTTFLVNDDEVEKRATPEGFYSLGDFPVGTYEITGLLDTEYVSLENEISSYHYYQDDPIHLTFDLQEVYINTNVGESSLHVNGNESEVTIPFEGNYFGPVVLDGSLQLHLEKETPFGNLSTEHITLEGNQYEYQLDFGLSSSILDEAIEDLAADLEDSYDRLKSGNSDVEILESINVYTDDHYIEYSQDAWYLTLESEEKWQREVSTSWFNDSSTIQEETDYKNYTLIFSEEDSQWELEDHRTINYLTVSDETFSPIKITDDDDITELISEDQLQQYRDDIEDELTNLFSDYFFEFADATRSQDTSEIVLYIDEDSTDFIEKNKNEMEELIDDNTTKTHLTTFDQDYSTDDEITYEVMITESYSIDLDDGQTSIKEEEYTFDVKLTSDGFKIVDLLESEVISTEEQ
ncbi:TcaA 3rd/4th domain-containing protein [Salipaludibacillus daqingensis]|uniref:TcaA 3rd/4th domain-containing protein n=1 Tax=Salipaludibacillus daqingensis TaxID=3041001 RepID=UPI00247439C0|nr:hypothetical protein [Salipaludibacillus daqingensis]